MSKMRGNVFALVLALALMESPRAQQTWLVGGAGSHFPNIQPALDVAIAGDTILVRAGDYFEHLITATRGVRVVAEPGARVNHGTSTTFRISGIPAGQRFVLKGLAFYAAFMTVSSNAGDVVLDDIDLPWTATGVRSSLTIVDSRLVVGLRVNVSGLGPVSCTRSRTFFDSCTFRGGPWIAALAGLRVSDSDVSITDCRISGGSGFGGVGAGIEMTSGMLRLAGKHTEIAAAYPIVPWPAISAEYGTVDIDPMTTLVPTGGAPEITGNAVIRRGPVPACVIDHLLGGSTSTVTLYSAQGSAFCLFAGVPIASTPSPFGTLWLDPSASIVLTCRTAPAQSGFSMSIGVPRGLPPGETFVVQAGVLLPTGLVSSVPGFAVAR